MTNKKIAAVGRRGPKDVFRYHHADRLYCLGEAKSVWKDKMLIRGLGILFAAESEVDGEREENE